MSTAIPLADPLPLVVPYQPARLSVADYHKLISCGTLAENHRLELLRGVVVEKMTHNPLHAALVGILQDLLAALLPAGFHTRSQVPITLSDSEPEPDVAIARGQRSDFLQRHPGPSETPLVIEVAASSLVTDRFKAEIYAEAGIPCYWIVNLPERQVEVFTKPALTAEGLRYTDRHDYQPGDSIPVVLDDRGIGVIAAVQLLPEQTAS
jgi:Uma2 family endonuclease